MSERKPVLLIADDDPELLAMLSTRFSKKGYDVVEAVDGVQAIRFARERKPDVVILDVMMPHRNGWEVAKELRADPALRSIGIIMLTAIGQNVNQMTSPLYGADDFVDKPFDFADLEARVARVAAGHRQMMQ